MGAFVIRRCWEAIPVLVLSSVVIFLGLRLIPGGLAVRLAGSDTTP